MAKSGFLGRSEPVVPVRDRDKEYEECPEGMYRSEAGNCLVKRRNGDSREKPECPDGLIWSWQLSQCIPEEEASGGHRHSGEIPGGDNLDFGPGRGTEDDPYTRISPKGNPGFFETNWDFWYQSPETMEVYHWSEADAEEFKRTGEDPNLSSLNINTAGMFSGPVGWIVIGGLALSAMAFGVTTYTGD